MLTKLKTEAARRALAARKRFGFAFDSPCDVYELISKYDLSLRFTNISSLDGLYLNDGLLGSINVSTLRPSGHQRFTAAHELGHFLFGHGGHLDEKIEDMESDSTEEAVADTFARHLLMPKRAVLVGFRSLGTTPDAATPEQYYALASWLGVGYSTLIQHIRWTLQLIDNARLHQLTLKTPQQIKRRQVPSISWTGRKELWPLASWWHGANIHLQIGDIVTGLKTPSQNYFDLGDGCAIARNVGQLSAVVHGGGSVTLNISKTDYIGMYQYRYLEEPIDA
jgi:Zn-dependent peptidase ImmA (M78 family)